MNNTPKREINFIEIMLIYLLICICSFQGFFVNFNSYLDECIILILLLYEFNLHYLNKKEKLLSKNIIPLLIFIIITLVNIVLKQYDPMAYFSEIINYLKIPIILFLPMYFNFDKKNYNKIIRFFIIINLISAFVGIYHFTFYNSIGYHLGDKFRNGLYRPSGLSGHPISLGFACVISIFFLISLKENKKNIFYIIPIIIFFCALILTQDRLPLFLLILFIFFKVIIIFLSKIKNGFNKLLPLLFLFGMLLMALISIMGYDLVMNYLKDDFDNTIRMYSLKKSYEVFKKYPVLGTGIGTFGGSASLKYNSYVYDEFNIELYENSHAIAKTSSNVFESFFAKLVIETGIFGFIIYLYLFKRLLKMTKNKFDLKYLVFCIFIYSFLNSIYQIPFILGMAILLANNYYNESRSG